MRDRAAENWEELGRREPYFGVLTDERFLRARMSDDARRAFFASGEADVERLFGLIRRTGAFTPHDALDFGCGVGRLTLALARRANRVVGIDVAASMIEHARANAKEAGLSNINLVQADDAYLESLPSATFDLICSLIVFQHVPVHRGEQIVRSLLRLLKPGGAAALQFTFRRPGGRLRRIARGLRARSPLLHRTIQFLQGDASRLPYMEMNEYDMDVILRALAEGGCGEPLIERTDHGGIEGAILIARKSRESGVRG